MIKIEQLALSSLARMIAKLEKTQRTKSHTMDKAKLHTLEATTNNEPSTAEPSLKILCFKGKRGCNLDQLVEYSLQIAMTNNDMMTLAFQQMTHISMDSKQNVSNKHV